MTLENEKANIELGIVTDKKEDYRLVESCPNCDMEVDTYHKTEKKEFSTMFNCVKCGNTFKESYRVDRDGIVWPSYMEEFFNINFTKKEDDLKTFTIIMTVQAVVSYEIKSKSLIGAKQKARKMEKGIIDRDQYETGWNWEGSMTLQEVKEVI